jgi:hypothetical protein
VYGDFSRLLEAPSGRYAAVLAQQGRFLLDAELNEQTSIVLDYLRLLTTDLIGPFAGPVHHTGFEVEPVDEQGACSAVKLTAGRYYVYGLRCQAPAPDSPFDEDDPIPIGRHEPPFVVYLAVWEQSVGAIQDPTLLEPALGPGVIDTTRRRQIRWYPRATDRLGDVDDLTSLDRNGIAEAFHEYNTDRSREPLLGARAHSRQAPEPGPASASGAGGYYGVENQLYRVEVHHGGNASEATFKWSRDNGSVELALESLGEMDTDGLRTATLGSGWRETQHGLQQGDWVELVDDRWAPFGAPPPLMQVSRVSLATRQVILKDTDRDREFDPCLHPLLRRWDHQPDSTRPDRGVPVTDADDQWLDLEDGIEVLFKEPGAHYRRGDYWLIPARTASPTGVLWPASNGNPEAIPPHGPTRYRAPLALVTSLPGTTTDLRIQFSHVHESVPEPDTAAYPTFKGDIPSQTATPRISIERPTFRLRSVSSERSGEEFEIYDGMTIGRDAESGISFVDVHEVSRSHARFAVGSDDVTVMDLGSTNGTEINGERIAPRQPIKLAPGNLIQFGTEAVQLQVEEA